MKKTVILTLILFTLSSLLPNAHRILNNEKKMIMLNPFYGQPNEKISLAWYMKDIGELISFSLIILVVCIILNFVKSYLIKEKVSEYYRMRIFLKLWQEIFWIIFVSSILDFGHYMLAFKHAEWFFLSQTLAFFGMSCFYIFKSFYRR